MNGNINIWNIRTRITPEQLVIFVHFKSFNISQKLKSSPLSYFETFRSDSCSYVSNIDTMYFRSLKRFWDCDFNFVNVLELHHSMENDKWYNKKSFDLAFHFSFWEIMKLLKWTNITSFFLNWLKRSTNVFISLWI
jgi:hypothetical protein